MKVTFMACGGYDGEKESAKKLLKIGSHYDVESISIHKWITYLKINGKYFIAFSSFYNFFKLLISRKQTVIKI